MLSRSGRLGCLRGCAWRKSFALGLRRFFGDSLARRGVRNVSALFPVPIAPQATVPLATRRHSAARYTPPVRNLSGRFRTAAASPPLGVEPQRPPRGSPLACLWVSHASSNWKPGQRAPLRKTPGSAPPETGRPECPPSPYTDYWQFKPNSGVIPVFFDSFCRPRPNPDETVPIRQSPSGDNSHSRGSR